MIPSLLAREIRRGVDDYLKTTFPVTSPYFGGVVEEFLAREAALARGPYVSVGLPFSPGKRRGVLPPCPWATGPTFTRRGPSPA